MKKRVLFVLCALLALAVALVCSYCAVQFLKTAPTATSVHGVTVIIDAGHGGEDGGASSRDGVLESTLNLEIAQRVEDLLHFAGIGTKMIRTEDISVYTDGANIQQKKVSDLKNRVRMVNDTPGALLVSIHQNFFPESKYRGAQVFYAKTPGSEQLAGVMQDALRACADEQNHRRCKPSESVYLMEKAACTAVLVECGFLSNGAEAELLQQPHYQQKLAAGICGAISRFLETEGDTDEV